MVSDTDGPTDQTRLGHSNKCLMLELDSPTVPPMVTVGKKAASATPMAALAWAMVRSAAATSGLRSSSCEGKPRGTAGGAASRGRTGTENVDGLAPVSTAIACSYWARATPTLVAAACALCREF